MSRLAASPSAELQRLRTQILQVLAIHLVAAVALNHMLWAGGVQFLPVRWVEVYAWIHFGLLVSMACTVVSMLAKRRDAVASAEQRAVEQLAQIQALRAQLEKNDELVRTFENVVNRLARDHAA